jgi:monoterpene epsilon-lactone hydrolase
VTTPPLSVRTAYQRRWRLSGEESAAERALLGKLADFWTSTPGDMRTIYDASIAATPLAPGVSTEEESAGVVHGWWCRPEHARTSRSILYLHGGGYGLGSARAYRGLASQIAARTEISTFVLEFPLAPEHPFPAAMDLAELAFRWLTERGTDKIAVAGDSSGGGLALALVTATPGLVGCAVFSPWTDLALTGATFATPEIEDTLLTAIYLANSAKQYIGATDPRDPRVSPLYGVHDRLPPIHIQVGTRERLLDDSRRYAELTARLGVVVQLEVFEGMHHVFQLNVEELSSARLALDVASAFLKTCFHPLSEQTTGSVRAQPPADQPSPRGPSTRTA